MKNDKEKKVFPKRTVIAITVIALIALSVYMALAIEPETNNNTRTTTQETETSTETANVNLTSTSTNTTKISASTTIASPEITLSATELYNKVFLHEIPINTLIRITGEIDGVGWDMEDPGKGMIRLLSGGATTVRCEFQNSPDQVEKFKNFREGSIITIQGTYTEALMNQVVLINCSLID
ncbi:hypothetical protein CL634_05580 [bacterium]|nr:hypothetical protein [bacterium]